MIGPDAFISLEPERQDAEEGMPQEKPTQAYPVDDKKPAGAVTAPPATVPVVQEDLVAKVKLLETKKQTQKAHLEALQIRMTDNLESVKKNTQQPINNAYTNVKPVAAPQPNNQPTTAAKPGQAANANQPAPPAQKL